VDTYIPAAPMPDEVAKAWLIGRGGEEVIALGPGEAREINGSKDMTSSLKSIIGFAQKQHRQVVEYNSRQARINDEPCSYCISNVCSEIEGRCGGRKLYAAGIMNAESDMQKALPHTCRYHPESISGYVFIASDDQTARHTLISICRTYLGIGDDRIKVMDAAGSEEEFRMNKQQDNDISLLISDSPRVIKNYKERNFVSHIYFFGDESNLTGDTRLFYENKLVTNKGLNLSHIESTLTAKGFIPKI
jgi:hypothetical protein